MSQAANASTNLEGKLGGLSTFMKGALVASIAAVGAAVAATVADSVRQFTTFEESLNKVATIADTSAMGMDEIAAGVKDVSNTVGVAAGEVAEAMYQAISAGASTADSLKYVEQAAMLAKGGFTDVSTAIDGVTSVLNAYGDSGEEAFTKVADMMVVTQNLGKTTVDELAASLAQVIPTAAAMGVGFEQVSAALAVMTAQGTPTAQATTQLNSLFAELGKSGTVAANNLTEALTGTEYAGKTFTELMNSGVPLSDLLNSMGEYAENNGLALLDMFSSIEAGKAALQVASGDGEKFADSLKAMGGAAGSTEAAFETMDSGLSATWNRISNSWDNLKLSLGGSIAPTLEAALTGINAMMPQITASIQGALTGLSTFLRPITGAMSTLFSTMSTGSAATNTAWSSMYASISTVFSSLQQLFSGLIQAFNSIWAVWGTDITNLLFTVWQTISSIFSAAINVITAVVQTFTALLTGDWQGFLNGLLSICTTAWELIKAVLVGHLESYAALASYYLNLISTAVSTWWSSLTNTISSAWGSFTEWLTGVWDSLVQWFAGLGETFNQIGQNLFNSLWNGIQSVWDSISSWISDKIGWLTDALSQWRSGTAEMSGGSGQGIDGSHANGLSYVPFDGYTALLHKGERVLTAQQNAQYSTTTNNSGGDTNITVDGITLNIQGNADSGTVDLLKGQVNAITDGVISKITGMMSNRGYGRKLRTI